MLKSLSVSSESSFDDVDSVSSDELLGSQSRRWLAELMTGDLPSESGELRTVDRDGLFVDYQFPVGELELQSGVRWKRPKVEIMTVFLSHSFLNVSISRSSSDLNGFSSDDCWFLAAIASLSVHRSLLNKVVPPGQSFQEGYNGSFTFKFWQYGVWEEVRIDDLLPTRDNQLIYLTSPDMFEFWSPLLEKAYAKLKGGYRALDMGFPHEAMVDMTGGVTEVLNIASLPRGLTSILRHVLSKGALINCANCQGSLAKMNDLGIMYRHAYSVTAVEEVKTAHGTEELVRILNPWGNTEWLGPWSDENGCIPEWSSVSPEEQKRLQRVIAEDGEFWMSIADFRQQFEMMEVCHLSENFCDSRSGVEPWYSIMLHGNWVPGFCLNLLEADDDDTTSQKTCSFVLALMQKHQRRRGTNMAIALHVYPATPPVLFCPNYSTRREVVLRGSLPLGRYIIIPFTAKPDQQGSFLLRVLTEEGNTTQGFARLNWEEFQSLWDKIKRWTVGSHIDYNRVIKSSVWIRKRMEEQQRCVGRLMVRSPPTCRPTFTAVPI
uniref:Zgc:85932 n=1 Tax=Cynoglossus semilaevis TaxID=244447 RepID=A0A3P8V983_CYNSE